jgi:hypothetical protein
LIESGNKIRLNIKAIEKRSKELITYFHHATQESVLTSLMKDTSRVEFIAFALLSLLNSELKDKADVASYFMSTFKSLNQCIESFGDLLASIPLTPSHTKNSSPFSMSKTNRDSQKRTIVKQNV